MDVLTNPVMVTTLQYIRVQIITLYTLNLYNVKCQLYLNKAGRKKGKKCFYCFLPESKLFRRAWTLLAFYIHSEENDWVHVSDQEKCRLHSSIWTARPYKQVILDSSNSIHTLILLLSTELAGTPARVTDPAVRGCRTEPSWDSQIPSRMTLGKSLNSQSHNSKAPLSSNLITKHNS